MSKHTEGPWRAQQKIDERLNPYWIIVAEHLGMDGCLARTWEPIEVGESGAKANAHLIAAAPDLLEALEDLVPIVDALDSGMAKFADILGETEPAPEAEKARAAIAKAKGENQ